MGYAQNNSYPRETPAVTNDGHLAGASGLSRHFCFEAVANQSGSGGLVAAWATMQKRSMIGPARVCLLASG